MGNLPENKSQHIFQQEKPLCTSPIVPRDMHVQHPLEAKLLESFYLEIISAARKNKLQLGREDKLTRVSLGHG